MANSMLNRPFADRTSDQITLRIAITLAVVGGAVTIGLVWFGWWFLQQYRDHGDDDGSHLDEQSKRKQTATMGVQHVQNTNARHVWAKVQDLERDNRLVVERAAHDPMMKQFHAAHSPRSTMFHHQPMVEPYVVSCLVGFRVNFPSSFQATYATNQASGDFQNKLGGTPASTISFFHVGSFAQPRSNHRGRPQLTQAADFPRDELSISRLSFFTRFPLSLVSCGITKYQNASCL